MEFNPGEHFMQLKGKNYLQVAWRLVWFRELHPDDWAILTELVSDENNRAIFKATILNADGAIVQTAYGSESVKDFGDYLEKAETKAVGRALAMAGFGTQFALDDLDEGQRIVDSPIEKKAAAPKKAAPAVPAPAPASDCVCEDCKKPVTAKSFGGTEYSAAQITSTAQKRYHVNLCMDCYMARTKKEKENKQ